MPSTVVHVGLAGLVGAALLGDRFDTRAILFVMAATAIIDLDTLIGIYRRSRQSASGLDPEAVHESRRRSE